ncbi:MAG: methyltransferase domain-containing protein [Planctomycetia bacterium]|nr:methyltransferase domain-containing protein [Planctomycetia bacterium]
MALWPDLRERRREPEIMDEPGLDERAHVGALTALSRINFWSGSAGILWRELLPLLRASTQPFRLLDVATGGGDVPLRLWHRARRAGVTLEIEGCDKSATAIDHAARRAAAEGADLRYFVLDVLNAPIPERYDAVVCSLFLHHLDDGPAVELLRRMADAARRLVLVNDLERSSAGYALAWLGVRALSRSRVAHRDGPLSVQGAYTPDEARALARQAGLTGATAARRWPFRFLLTWKRPT